MKRKQIIKAIGTETDAKKMRPQIYSLWKHMKENGEMERSAVLLICEQITRSSDLNNFLDHCLCMLKKNSLITKKIKYDI